MKIVPLISSGTAGPLGVLHLPRLWLKTSLEARGILADGYPGCGTGGYDNMVLEALGIPREAFVDYIKNSKPTYPELEKWILDQKGGKIDTAAVEKLNSAIRGYNHADDVRTSILSENKIDSADIKDAVNLNNLDDWKCFHSQFLN